MKNAIDTYLQIKFEQGEVAASRYYDATVELMDDSIREDLHRVMADEASESEFLTAYCDAHRREYDEEFEVN
jgi:hypothetical protein